MESNRSRKGLCKLRYSKLKDWMPEVNQDGAKRWDSFQHLAPSRSGLIRLINFSFYRRKKNNKKKKKKEMKQLLINMIASQMDIISQKDIASQKGSIISQCNQVTRIEFVIQSMSWLYGGRTYCQISPHRLTVVLINGCNSRTTGYTDTGKHVVNFFPAWVPLVIQI